jgi:uncharacterized protein
VPSTLDAALLTAWARTATAALERHSGEVDRINVFPVADGDTGTNLLLTMRAARAEAGRAPSRSGAGVAEALARGALSGARGNSGMVLSQVLRGLAEAIAAAGPGAPAVLADALCRGRELAVAALATPQEGTVLTVLAEAARAARRASVSAAEAVRTGLADADARAPAGRVDRAAADDLPGAALHVAAPLMRVAGTGAVAEAAVVAAGRALAATTSQLPALARAGVVDAGGLGIWIVLDALAAVLADRPPSTRLPVASGPRQRSALTAERESGSADFDYEVQYLLDAPEVDDLRSALVTLGDSVAVIGDGQGLWNVHVHCNDVGAAIEAGVAAGRPHGITVVRFADQAAPDTGRFARSRSVLLVVPGPELAVLAREAGAAVLLRDAEPVTVPELVAALAGTMARHVVLLPDDAELVPVAEAAAGVARREGQEVLVLPTSSVLQGLAALAVHDPGRRPAEDVVAMAEAAAGTRTAALIVAESEALTWVGRCEPGDVLGIADGEVVLIAPDLAVGALWLAHRMLLGGGEIVTALLGAGADDALGEGLAADLRRTHREVDVVVHRGGPVEYPLVLGVE